jgi:hypothetical protein
MTLWIDAICINQRDLVERNQQVNMMIEIYSEAEETLIWMGLNNAPWNEVSSLEKLRHVEKLVVNTIIDLTNSSDLKDSTARIARFNSILIEPAESDLLMVWRALIAIFRHTWWTRLWVHQELVAAQKATVVVGLHAFAWESFLPLLRVLSRANGWDYSAADLIALPKLRSVAIGYYNLLKSCGYQSLASRYLARDNEHLRLVRNQQRNLDIASGKISRDDPEMLDLDAREAIESLYWTRRYHCADPRDHVFALRGLLTDGEILAEADYTISTKELYARFARRFIGIYKSTNILRLAGLTWRGLSSSDDLGACPSWIPYLGTIDDFELIDKVLTPLWTFGMSDYLAAAKDLGRARKSTVGENDEQLSVHGYPVDVLDIMQPFFMEIVDMPFEDFTRSVWRELIPTLPLSYPTGCDPKHALLGVLTGNQNLEMKGCVSPCQERISDAIAWIENEDLLDEQRVLESFIDNQHSPVAPSSMVSAPGTLEKMLRDPTWSSEIAAHLRSSISSATVNRKFLRTERGFMGLAPQPAEVGDEVWILLGCDVPMILRKCDDYYTLVGECFVYGMMEGEQTKNLLASGPPKNIILH